MKETDKAKTADALEDLRRALELNGIKKTDEVKFHQMNGRIRVTINGTYYGVWDIIRRTFVD